jgi:hypothetical protein
MRDLASEAGVSLGAINRLECGSDARTATVEKIVAAFAAHGVDLIADATRTGAVLELTRRRR